MIRACAAERSGGATGEQCTVKWSVRAKDVDVSRNRTANDRFMNTSLGFVAGLVVGVAITFASIWLSRRLEEEHDLVLQALLDAPVDDDPLTPEDEQALAEAREEMSRGDLISWEEVKRSLRITA
jgi:hypothetical protein